MNIIMMLQYHCPEPENSPREFYFSDFYAGNPTPVEAYWFTTGGGGGLYHLWLKGHGLRESELSCGDTLIECLEKAAEGLPHPCGGRYYRYLALEMM
jgi:hypothetical protein